MITEDKDPTPRPPPPGGEGENSTEILSAQSNTRVSSPPLPPGEGAGGWGSWRLVHLLVLLAGLGLWTWKLLEPNPVPEAVSARLQGEWQFVAAKALHASGYAFLTLLAVTLPVPSYWRWYLAGLLALHGAATEIGQTFVPNRTGSVRDVLIDWAGVALGVLIWRAARRGPVTP